MRKPKKERLDALLTARGLTASNDAAYRLIMAGKVTVDNVCCDKPGTLVRPDSQIELDSGQASVSRAADKLSHAIQEFVIAIHGKVCVDVGACSGGFTQVLLRLGAARVYSIDVASGVLAWEVRKDPRVIVMEDTNATRIGSLPEPISFVCIDVSLISLRSVLPNVKSWLMPDGDIIALVKPHYEAASEDLPAGAVIRDAALHRDIVVSLLEWADSMGLYTFGLARSPITGRGGNTEFLAWFKKTAQGKLIPRSVQLPPQLV